MQIIFQCMHYSMDLIPGRQVVSGKNRRMKVILWFLKRNKNKNKNHKYVQITLLLQIGNISTGA